MRLAYFILQGKKLKYTEKICVLTWLIEFNIQKMLPLFALAFFSFDLKEILVAPYLFNSSLIISS